MYIIMIMLELFVSTAVDNTNNYSALHSVIINSTDTIIILMPPFPHYSTSDYSIASTINSATTFHMHRYVIHYLHHQFGYINLEYITQISSA